MPAGLRSLTQAALLLRDQDAAVTAMGRLSKIAAHVRGMLFQPLNRLAHAMRTVGQRAPASAWR